MSFRDATRVARFSFLAMSLFWGSVVFAIAPEVFAIQTAESTQLHVVQMVNVFANLQKTVDAKKSNAGDAVSAKVLIGATLSDGFRIPAGAILIGHIDSITSVENSGKSTLVLTFDRIAIKHGQEIPVKAVIMKVAHFGSSYGGIQAERNPTENRPAAASIGPPSGVGVVNQPVASSAGYFPIDGLRLSASPNDPSSGTLIQEKKNIHLASDVQFIVSVAVLPK